MTSGITIHEGQRWRSSTVEYTIKSGPDVHGRWHAINKNGVFALLHGDHIRSTMRLVPDTPTIVAQNLSLGPLGDLDYPSKPNSYKVRIVPVTNDEPRPDGTIGCVVWDGES